MIVSLFKKLILNLIVNIIKNFLKYLLAYGSILNNYKDRNIKIFKNYYLINKLVKYKYQ